MMASRWILTCVIGLAPMAAQASICSFLLAANVETRLPEMLDAVNTDGFEIDELLETSGLLDDAEYWVTITTGPAKWINCEKQKAEKSIYHPIGLLLRPVRDVRMESRDHTIFQTEYGLNVIIDNAAVAPVTKRAAYVFADANRTYQVCKPNAFDDCNGWTEFRPKGAGSNDWPYISGNKGYLFDKDASVVDAAAEAWAELKTKLDAAVAHGFDANASLEAACGLNSAWLYRPFKKHDPAIKNEGAEYPGPVGYSLCSTDPITGDFRYRQLKFVTPDTAAEKFDGLWAVAAAIEQDQTVVDSLKDFFGFSEPVITFKPCGVPLENHITIASLSSAPLNRGETVDLGAELLSEVQSGKTDLQVHFKAYETALGQSTKEAIFSAPLFQDVELEILCDDNMVSKAGALRIHSKPVLGKRPLELNFDELDSAYDVSFNKYGRASDRIRLDRLKRGKLFRVCDFIEYTNWRKLLREQFLAQERVLMAAQDIGVTSTTLADHFAHLVMATFFFTDAKMIKKSKEEEEKCTS